MRISKTSASLSACLVVLLAAAMTVTAWGASKAPATTIVDVNSADVKTLETLPGIGSALANRIVEGRPYKNLDDLGKVKGLSKSKLDTIQDKITFGSTTAKKSSSKSASKSAKTTTSATGSASSPGGTSTGANKSTSKAQTTASKPSGGSSGSSSSSSSSSGKLKPGQTVNINTATAEELDALPGIGPTKAQAIIDYRNQNGRFNSIEDIEKVKGIKEGEFGKIKDYIRVR